MFDSMFLWTWRAPEVIEIGSGTWRRLSSTAANSLSLTKCGRLHYTQWNAMAFPVPDHLPRKTMPKDISTEILTKVSEVTTKTLTSSLVTSWVDELEAGVQNTKVRNCKHLFLRYIPTDK